MDASQSFWLHIPYSIHNVWILHLAMTSVFEQKHAGARWGPTPGVVCQHLPQVIISWTHLLRVLQTGWACTSDTKLGFFHSASCQCGWMPMIVETKETCETLFKTWSLFWTLCITTDRQVLCFEFILPKCWCRCCRWQTCQPKAHCPDREQSLLTQIQMTAMDSALQILTDTSATK